MDESSANTRFAGDYPPENHILTDLNFTLEIEGSQRATICAPITEAVCNDQGSIHVGIIGTLVDVVGGSVAIRAIFPDWIATSSMTIHTPGPAKSGVITATGSPMRVGRAMGRQAVEHRLAPAPRDCPG